MISLARFQRTWDRLAPADFAPASLHPVQVGGVRMLRVHVPRSDTPCPERLVLGGNLIGVPRFAAYRHRVVLLPGANRRRTEPWAVQEEDLRAWLAWSRHADHVVTFSTLKSGASVPLKMHAQSFPRCRDGVEFSALPGAEVKVLIAPGQMPHFGTLEIAELRNYPLRGLRLAGEEDQVARKLMELILNYDHLKAFNLVLVPEPSGNGGCRVHAYLFPRRRDGHAIFRGLGGRWQIAALECNGLLQAKREEDLKALTPGCVRRLFREISPDRTEYGFFRSLVDSF